MYIVYTYKTSDACVTEFSTKDFYQLPFSPEKTSLFCKGEKETENSFYKLS